MSSPIRRRVAGSRTTTNCQGWTFSALGPHGFPALIRVLLRDRYPDVLQALRDSGVIEVSIMPTSVPPDAPGYDADAEDLQVLSCRRTPLEWVLRRCALAEDDVSLRVGVGVGGLLVDARTGGAPLTVRGVHLDDGTELAADVVVVSSGQRSDLPGWFAAHGVEIVEEAHPTGTIYLSRFYRSDDGDTPTGFRGGRRAGIGFVLAGIGFVLAGADHGTYSATLAIDASDAELRSHLLDPDRFQAVLPCSGRWNPSCAPTARRSRRCSRWARSSTASAASATPTARHSRTGFFATGDAHTCTNPLYGRGSSLAVLQAVLVADALGAHPDDADAAARAYEAASAARVEPWYDVSLLTDLAASAPPAPSPTEPDAAASPGAGTSRTPAAGEPAPPTLDLGTMRRIVASGDPELAVLVARTMSLLVTPQAVFGDPEVISKLNKAAASTRRPRDPNRPRRRRITRDDLLAAGAR